MHVHFTVVRGSNRESLCWRVWIGYIFTFLCSTMHAHFTVVRVRSGESLRWRAWTGYIFTFLSLQYNACTLHGGKGQRELYWRVRIGYIFTFLYSTMRAHFTVVRVRSRESLCWRVWIGYIFTFLCSTMHVHFMVVRVRSRESLRWRVWIGYIFTFLSLQYNACTLHGGKGQEQREFALASLNRGFGSIPDTGITCLSWSSPTRCHAHPPPPPPPHTWPPHHSIQSVRPAARVISLCRAVFSQYLTFFAIVLCWDNV